MIDDMVQPESIVEFQRHLELASSEKKQVMIVGSRSKTRIANGTSPTVISTTRFAGIVDHQADDFTITVRAGTRLKQITELLDSAGQYLPFDPVFVDQGATIGGLVGSGLNGPCRLRFGGQRDFLIGCQFIDGRGRVVRAGGKVVKNAAGFDLSKFLIGSAGKFGILLEVTFKVFPRPRLFQSAVFETATSEAALETLRDLVNSQTGWDGLEILENHHLAARWSAPSEESMEAQTRELQQSGRRFQILKGAAESQFWNELGNFESTDSSGIVIKVPLVPRACLLLDTCFSDLKIRRRLSAAGNVAYLFLGSEQLIGETNSRLWKLGLSGQVVVGPNDYFLIGAAPQMPFLRRVKSALDPGNSFGPIEDSRSAEVAR